MNDIDKALKTWYAKDHPLHLDPLHPTIKLAGEVGELLDLYGKHEYKPGFDWWNCKHCNKPRKDHTAQALYCFHWSDRPRPATKYVPLIVDELGDYTYYLRIICYIADIPLEKINGENYHYWPVEKLLAIMAQNSCVILNDYLDHKQIDISRLKVIWGCLEPFISELGLTWKEIIDSNYRKLNSEPTNHGWKDA